MKSVHLCAQKIRQQRFVTERKNVGDRGDCNSLSYTVLCDLRWFTEPYAIATSSIQSPNQNHMVGVREFYLRAHTHTHKSNNKKKERSARDLNATRDFDDLDVTELPELHNFMQPAKYGSPQPNSHSANVVCSIIWFDALPMRFVVVAQAIIGSNRIENQPQPSWLR